jgi:exodeoxyribonuclease VII large subunit
MAERLRQFVDNKNRDLDTAEAGLENLIQRRFSECHRLLDRFHRTVSSIEPARLAAVKKLELQAARQNLIDTMYQRLNRRRPQLEKQYADIQQAAPAARIARFSAELEALRHHLPAKIRENTRLQMERCDFFRERLLASHPDVVIKRGFSITFSDDGRIVQSVSDVSIGRKITTRLLDGAVVSVVETTSRDEQPGG